MPTHADPSANAPIAALMDLGRLGFDVARDLRTAALWLAGPLDRLHLRLTGRNELPPLWLRRHAGRASDFESAARDMEAILRQVRAVGETDQVLEIGCGCGAMVPAITRLLGPQGRYVGFDVHGPSIGWCRRHFARDQRLRFEVAKVASPYGAPSNDQPVDSYRFPVADGGADFILAKSVFTHLLDRDVRHYMREIRRTLRPERVAIITAFLFDGRTRPPAFPFPHRDSPMRWLRRWRVQAGVAFERSYFERLIGDAGLTLRSMIPGYWPGTTSALQGQDILVLTVSQS